MEYFIEDCDFEDLIDLANDFYNENDSEFRAEYFYTDINVHSYKGLVATIFIEVEGYKIDIHNRDALRWS